MFIFVNSHDQSKCIINTSFIKSIAISGEGNHIIYCHKRDNTDIFYYEPFETIEHANKRYLELCKLLEIK